MKQVSPRSTIEGAIHLMLLFLEEPATAIDPLRPDIRRRVREEVLSCLVEDRLPSDETVLLEEVLPDQPYNNLGYGC